MNALRRIFNPTPEEEREDYRKYAAILRECINNRVCSTCIHYVIVPGYHPGFVTGGDSNCDTGRCPIETCEEYELDQKELEQLHRFEKLGWM